MFGSRLPVTLAMLVATIAACTTTRRGDAGASRTGEPAQRPLARTPEAGPPRPGEPCGRVTCPPGQVCCNESCGICTPPGDLCTQQLCEDPAPAAAPDTRTSCKSDGDCRLDANYCTGCDCLAVARTAPAAVCNGPGVRCFADPCLNKAAACERGTCTVKVQNGPRK